MAQKFDFFYFIFSFANRKINKLQESGSSERTSVGGVLIAFDLSCQSVKSCHQTAEGSPLNFPLIASVLSATEVKIFGDYLHDRPVSPPRLV